MAKNLSDDLFHQIVGELWEAIGSFAFDGYHNHGRGVVGIEEVSGGDGLDDLRVRLLYTIYKTDNEKTDPGFSRMIAAYDPKWELVIQYAHEQGGLRTMRLRTREGARHPWRVWFFEKLSEEFGDQEE